MCPACLSAQTAWIDSILKWPTVSSRDIKTLLTSSLANYMSISIPSFTLSTFITRSRQAIPPQLREQHPRLGGLLTVLHNIAQYNLPNTTVYSLLYFLIVRSTHVQTTGADQVQRRCALFVVTVYNLPHKHIGLQLNRQTRIHFLQRTTIGAKRPAALIIQIG